MRRYTKNLLSLNIRINIRNGYVRDLECFSIDKTPLLETIGKLADALDIDIRLLFDNIETQELKLEKKAIV